MKLTDKLFNTHQRHGLTGRQQHFQLPEKLSNPWPGLAAYKDPLQSGTKRLFCGRDKESFEMTRMIDDNIFTTLYGKSGNGKTSLLNAGVFPLLRKMQYVPVSLRLGMEPAGRTFQESIIRAIENQFGKERIEEMWVIEPMQDRSAGEYLWNYFARHRFYADEQQETPVYPVVVLDQLEEVYKKRKQDADTLLRQIHYLMDKSHELESCITEEGLLYEYEYNFRFVISIREDDLFLLEDSIDQNYLQTMKQTRYRLLPISRTGARDVILKPAEEKHLFAINEQEKIVKTIIDIAQGNDKNNPISSNVLSLICNRIYVSYYEQMGGKGHISYELVEQFVSSNPLERFYQEATRHLSRNERAYLEDNLVDVTGRRGTISKANFDDIFKKKADSLLSGPLKILQENSGKVELIHDSFCQVLNDQKAKRLERWRNIVEHGALMAMCVVISYLSTKLLSYSWQLEAETTLQAPLLTVLNYIPILQIVFLFIITGTIRRSFPLSYTQLATILILFPIGYEWFFNTDDRVHLPWTFYVVAVILLVFLAADYVMVKQQRKHLKPEKELRYSELLDIKSLRFWIFVYLCYFVYILMYKSVDGSYSDSSIGFMAMFTLPLLFYSLFNKEDWGMIVFLMLPISIMIYFTSDVEFLQFSEVSTIQKIIWSGLIIYFLVTIGGGIIEELENKAKGIFWIFIVIALLFGYYYLFYQNKFLMLAIWCAVFYLLAIWLGDDNSLPKILAYVATFLFTLGLFVFLKGYNPTIAGVDANQQTGKWRWKNVIAYDGSEYRLRDAITGNDVLGAGFAKQGKNWELKMPLSTKANITYSVVNPLLEVPGDSNELTYKVTTLFEERVSRAKSRKRLVASTFATHRQRIFDIYSEAKQTTDNDKDIQAIHRQLLAKERQKISAILKSGSDSIVKSDLPRQLCKGLSCSWLYNVTDRSHSAIDSYNTYFYLVAFVHYALSYYYEDIFEYQEKDWDGRFETIASSYLEYFDYCPDAKLRDQYLQYVVPRLINYYQQTEDYGLKTLLYGKIVRLQQLAIHYGLGQEAWAHIALSSPVGIDIRQYYKEYRQKARNSKKTNQ